MKKNDRPELAAAEGYLLRGFQPIPIKYKSKRPVQKGWCDARLSTTDLPAAFACAPCNVGVVLGSASGGLVDVDIDSADALELAHLLLPATGMIFGRQSSKASHWIYKTDVPPKRIAYDDGTSLIVEIRGSGHQTVFPGSTHESGEIIRFDKDGDPDYVSFAELSEAVSRLAVATAIKRHWHSGRRHQLALSLAGLMKQSGWSRMQAEQVIGAVATASGDREVGDRLLAVQDTFASANPVSGASRLSQLLGRALTDKIADWVVGQPQARAAEAFDVNAAGRLVTDIGSAEAFAQEHKDSLIFSKPGWFERNGGVYRTIDPVRVSGLAQQFMKNAAASPYLFQHRVKLESKSRNSAIVELSKSHLAIDECELDQDPMIAGCSNGEVIDLSTRRILRRSDTIVTKRLGTALEAVAGCGRWQSFLTRIFNGDTELIEFIRRAVGYSLTGRTGEQCIFLLTGTGANGKSTFLSILQSLFGEYAASTPMQTLMVSKSEQSNDLAALVGKRLVCASEGEASQKLAESKIKLMTGGDRISCRRLYQEYFGYEPQFKLWITTNVLPKISGTDEAIWRRIRVIEFPVTIPVSERDANLTAKLKEELPGILNWALAGLADWLRYGLKPPKQVEIATSNYRQDSDTVEQFITSRCHLGNAGSKTATGVLYAAYSRWCEHSGLDACTKESFGKALARKQGLQRYKLASGNGWKGIELLTAEDSELLKSQY